MTHFYAHILTLRIVTNAVIDFAVNRAYHSFTHALSTILKEEGIIGLYYPGLVASLIREGSYSSIRMGLYPVVKNFFAGSSGSDTSFVLKFGAGMVTGALGSALANPTDLVKIRMQVDSGKIQNGVFVVSTLFFSFFLFLFFPCTHSF